jgi:hypothetical protein
LSEDKPKPKYKLGQFVRPPRTESERESTFAAAAIKSVEWIHGKHVYTIHGMGDKQFSEEEIELAGKKKDVGY